VAYTADDILATFDDSAGAGEFPAFDNAYLYPADCRLTAYRDSDRWAVAVEILGCNPKRGGHGGIWVDIHFTGNCLTLGHDEQWGQMPVRSIAMTDDGPEGPTFVGEGTEDVRPEATSIRIRGTVVPIPTDPAMYADLGIDLSVFSERQAARLLAHLSTVQSKSELKQTEKRLKRQVLECRGQTQLTARHLLRALAPMHRQHLLATDAERRAGIPHDLPQIIQLDGWRHPDITRGELPSQSESFALLADVLAGGEVNRYQPVQLPNTHWSNWPSAGDM
jgi:hypothetical protein